MRLAIALLLSISLTSVAHAYDWDDADGDRDGYSINEGDCDDGNPDINPGCARTARTASTTTAT